MALRSKHSLITTASLFSLALTGGWAVSCGAYKNYDERNAAAAEQELPDYDCPNGVCREDPGSREVTAEDCKAAEEGYEFFPIPIWDFNGYKAAFTYSYIDDTTENFQPRGWELLKNKDFEDDSQIWSDDPWKRCGREGNSVLRVKGGPFQEWGGGFGRSMRCINGNEALVGAEPGTTDGTTKGPYAIDELWKYYCTAPELGTVCGAAQSDPTIAASCPKRDRLSLAAEEVPAEDIALLGQSLDMSKWEGVSFWARRTPNSQAGIRALIADRYTDDDIAFIQYLVDPAAPRACERGFTCWCQDQNLPCTAVTAEEAALLNTKNDGTTRPVEAGDQLCLDRDAGPLKINYEYKVCGDTACGWPSSSAKSLNAGGATKEFSGGEMAPAFRDVQYDGLKCQEYSYRGSITSGYCYDPASEDPRMQAPPEGSEQCGDHWMKSIRLSYDWEFYKVPFTELLQQGWAKRQYWLDLTAVTMARITWDRGYVDFYIDDVRFYRKKQ
jgi:hypothetical protein